MLHVDGLMLVLECLEHDARVFRSDVVDCLSQVNWLISIFAPKFQQELGEAKGSAKVVKLRRTNFIDFFQEWLADAFATEVVIDSTSTKLYIYTPSSMLTSLPSKK